MSGERRREAQKWPLHRSDVKTLVVDRCCCMMTTSVVSFLHTQTNKQPTNYS